MENDYDKDIEEIAKFIFLLYYKYKSELFTKIYDINCYNDLLGILYIMVYDSDWAAPPQSYDKISVIVMLREVGNKFCNEDELEEIEKIKLLMIPTTITYVLPYEYKKLYARLKLEYG